MKKKSKPLAVWWIFLFREFRAVVSFHVANRSYRHVRISQLNSQDPLTARETENIQNYAQTFALVPGAQPFVRNEINLHVNETFNYVKGWGQGLALEKRPKIICKWAIADNFNIFNSMF